MTKKAKAKVPPPIALIDDLDAQVDMKLEKALRFVARAIRRGRARRRVTQKELGVLVGTAQSRISLLETDLYSKYNLAALARVAVALRLEMKLTLRNPEEVRLAEAKRRKRLKEASPK